MDSPPRKIEIFEPFGQALELTKRILFQPFDLSKWLVIGFAAFLALLGSGTGGSGFNFNPKDADVKFRSAANDALESADAMPAWVIPLLVVAGVLIIALIVLCTWLGARGKFIFADCVVQNRAAIVEPWKEYRREGNSYFLFWLIAGVLMLLVTALASAPLWLPAVLGGEFPEGMVLVIEIAAAGLVFIVLAIALALVLSFMVPIMYRRRCGAIDGARAAVGMITSHPGPLILYALFKAVLFIAFLLVSCVLVCVTCCLAAIPYVGTVILLPVHVLFMAFLLLFVRQFGPDYDAWGNLPVVTAAPPVQEPPPSPPSSGPPPLPA